MSKELVVGVIIGGALSSAFTSAMGGAKTTLGQLGVVAEQLQAKQTRLGDTMSRALSHPMRSVGLLRQEYTRLGQTLDQLRGKQERLAASMARGEALRDARSQTWGQIKETAGFGLAVGAPLIQSVRLSAGFQDQLRDVAITGEFSAAEENQLGASIRASALQWNQTQAEIGRGIGVLVAGGIQDAKALGTYAPMMAKAATATRASMDDLGSVAIALKDNLKIGEAGFEGALNMLSYAGKRGQFEIRDMAKWLPALSPMFQGLGLTGKEAVAEIGAALQIARKGAGSNDEAANNFRNFLGKVTAPDTLKDFEKAGIDLKSSMKNLRAEGFTPVQAMLEVITQYMGAKGPAAAGDLKRALAIKDDAERQAALQRLSEAYKLGELFQDMQAMNFIRPALANMAELKDIKQGARGAENKGLLDEDFKKRMDTANSKFTAFKIQALDIGITIGDALLPPLTELLQAVAPAVTAFGAWAKEHPGLIRGVVGFAAGLVGLRLGVLGVAWGFNFLVASPLNAFKTGLVLIGSKWTLLQAAWQAGRFLPLISGLRAAGGGILTVGRFLIPFGKGLLMTFGMPLMLAGKGLWFLGTLLAGKLVSGIRLAGQAVLWLGRALLMNPIGLAIAGIALGAYLVYRYWTPISAFFKGLWSRVGQVFASGIGGITRFILNWSPVGLFYRGLAGVLKLFGVDMPKNFTDFGGMLIDGLVGGITRKFTSARDTVIQFGSDIKGWFASTLGIKSPSRVFMGFGDNIAQGAALGIERTGPRASQAAAAMAAATIAAGSMGLADGRSGALAGRASAALASAAAADAASAGPGRASRGGAAGAGLVIHFSPVIQMPGGSDAKGAVVEGLQLSMVELERLMDRVLQQRERRSN